MDPLFDIFEVIALPGWGFGRDCRHHPSEDIGLIDEFYDPTEVVVVLSGFSQFRASMAMLCLPDFCKNITRVEICKCLRLY